MAGERAVVVVSEAYERRSDLLSASSCNDHCGDGRLSRRGRFRRAKLCGVHRRNMGGWRGMSAMCCGACSSHGGYGFREPNRRQEVKPAMRKIGQESGSSISSAFAFSPFDVCLQQSTDCRWKNENIDRTKHALSGHFPRTILFNGGFYA